MSPHEDRCLVPDQTFFHPELIVSDVIYNPRKTKLLRMAEGVGCSTFNGMYMLLYQGAYAVSYTHLSLIYAPHYPKVIPILFMTVGFGIVGFLEDVYKRQYWS